MSEIYNCYHLKALYIHGWYVTVIKRQYANNFEDAFAISSVLLMELLIFNYEHKNQSSCSCCYKYIVQCAFLRIFADSLAFFQDPFAISHPILLESFQDYSVTLTPECLIQLYKN